MQQRGRWAFARTGRWLAGHALAATLLTIFVIAGFWQLGRHIDVRDSNAAVAQRQDLPPLDLDGLLAADTAAEVEEIEHRLANVPIERFDWHEGVLIRNRSHRGGAGCHLAVPTAARASSGTGGDGVLVVVGWLAQPSCTAAAPAGADRLDLAGIDLADLREARRITGRVRATQQRGLLGPTDPPVGTLATLARTDVERIDQQSALDLAPAYLEFVSADPRAGARVDSAAKQDDADADAALNNRGMAPLPLSAPTLSAGPHLGYTFQWFSFAAVAVVGYAMVLRHQARKGHLDEPPVP